MLQREGIRCGTTDHLGPLPIQIIPDFIPLPCAGVDFVLFGATETGCPLCADGFADPTAR